MPAIRKCLQSCYSPERELLRVHSGLWHRHLKIDDSELINVHSPDPYIENQLYKEVSYNRAAEATEQNMLIPLSTRLFKVPARAPAARFKWSCLQQGEIISALKVIHKVPKIKFSHCSNGASIDS